MISVTESHSLPFDPASSMMDPPVRVPVMEKTMVQSDDSWDAVGSVAMVSSFVPRRCGIATFTRDLTDAVAERDADVNVLSVAMNDRPEGYRYPQRVWFEINQNRLPEYRLAADFLNMSHVDVCCIQHEYGIFGGTEGGHILDLIRRLRMPVVATLHTVLQASLPTSNAR